MIVGRRVSGLDGAKWTSSTCEVRRVFRQVRPSEGDLEEVDLLHRGMHPLEDLPFGVAFEGNRTSCHSPVGFSLEERGPPFGPDPEEGAVLAAEIDDRVRPAVRDAFGEADLEIEILRSGQVPVRVAELRDAR